MGPMIPRLGSLSQQKVLTMAWTWVGYLSRVLGFKSKLYHEVWVETESNNGVWRENFGEQLKLGEVK